MNTKERNQLEQLRLQLIAIEARAVLSCHAVTNTVKGSRMEEKQDVETHEIVAEWHDAEGLIVQLVEVKMADGKNRYEVWVHERQFDAYAFMGYITCFQEALSQVEFLTKIASSGYGKDFLPKSVRSHWG